MSAVALVLSGMTLPTTCQMFFGRPRLKIDFTKTTFSSSGTGLIIEIHNAPIEHWFLKKIRVCRATALSLSIFVKITEHGTGRFISQRWFNITMFRGHSHQNIFDLDGGTTAQVNLLFHSPKDQNARFCPEEKSEYIPIEPGKYDCNIDLSWSEGTIETNRTIRVDARSDFTAWE